MIRFSISHVILSESEISPIPKEILLPKIGIRMTLLFTLLIGFKLDTQEQQ